MSVLVARDLTVSATLDGATVPVLQGLNFTVSPGEVFGLVGESGAGKSMIGRAVAHMLPEGFFVSGGGLEFAGRDLVAMPASERRALLGRDIAFIPQEPLTALNPVLTIGRQFDEHLARLGLRSARARREHALELCDAVHLPRGRDLLRAYPH
jgi:peptide/nickel transport system ATP-binding protein